MSHELKVSASDLVFFALITLLGVICYQSWILRAAAENREDQRETAIASKPVGIARVQMQGVEQEIKSCDLARWAFSLTWHTTTSAAELIHERERYCIDKIVRNIAVADADAAAALAHVIVEGPFNDSEDVQAIARDDPQAIKAVASLLAR